jgi:hypothetical protein
MKIEITGANLKNVQPKLMLIDDKKLMLYSSAGIAASHLLCAAGQPQCNQW